jgi:hypothetical protein
MQKRRLRCEQAEREERARIRQEERQEQTRTWQEARDEKAAPAEATILREEQTRKEAAAAAEAARVREEKAVPARASSTELPRAELKLQQEQFEWQKTKEARERAKQESVEAQLKLFGDISKNVAPKFPADLADIPMFFESAETVFEGVSVPVVLRAKLLVPHLGERQIIVATLELGSSKQLRKSRKILAERISANSFPV